MLQRLKLFHQQLARSKPNRLLAHRILVAASVASVLIHSCGSKLQTSPSVTPRTANAVDPSGSGNTNSDTATSLTGCQLADLPANLKAKGFKKLDINKLELKTPDNQPKTLCKYLTENKNTTAIIQFSGVLCLSCQDEAKDFSSALRNASPTGNKIGHIVALTDFWEDFSKDDFKKFMTQYAPTAIEAHDPDIAMWKYFSKNPASPTRPTIVTYDRRGFAYIINSEDSDPSKSIEAAKILVESAPIDQVTPAKPDSDPNQEPNPSQDDEWVPVEPNPTTSPSPGPSVSPSPSQSPSPSVGPVPSQKPLALNSSQNIALTDGQGGRSDIATYFENNDYLVIDLSQYNCVYCRQMADRHEQDASFKAKMQNGKCKTLTVVPSSDLSAWMRAYPATSFSGKTSRGISSLSGLARAYNVSFGGTPTVFMIDRSGKVMGQQVGGTPSQIQSLCQ